MLIRITQSLANISWYLCQFLGSVKECPCGERKGPPFRGIFILGKEARQFKGTQLGTEPALQKAEQLWAEES